MPNSIVMSKIRCPNPNLKRSSIRNRNYLMYIGTREGVDLSPIEKDMENLSEKAAASEESENELYLKYIAERPRSHGLFGNIDCTDIVSLSSDLSKMTLEGKLIYRGIVSLKEEDALTLSFDKKETWMDMMNMTMPDIARAFNIPIDKLNWTGAVHIEKGHPHCHYMFWRTDDKCYSPYIHSSVQNKCRSIFSKEIFKEERTQEVLNKTLSRDLILDLGKELQSAELDFLTNNNSVNNIPGKISNPDLKNISEKVLAFTTTLPAHGRLAYQLLPPENKVILDKIVDEIIELPMMQKEYANYLKANQDISDTYSPTSSIERRTMIRAEYDIKKRLANQVLKTCKELVQEKSILENYDKSQINDVLQFSNSSTAPSAPEDDFDEYFIAWSKNYQSAMQLIYSLDIEDTDVEELDKAISSLQKEAAKGNVLAYNELGKIYDKGIGIEADENLADEYYKKAFKGFHQLLNKYDESYKVPLSYFQYRLGKMYERGLGTEIDYDKARSFYKQAAYDEGNKYAQYSLGCMYLYGTGIEINDENKYDYHSEALFLFKTSAESENAYAAYAYANLAANEFQDIVTQDTINTYYGSALDGFLDMYGKQITDDLAYRIGTMYENGLGTKKNYNRAISYLEESLKFKNENAGYALAKIYADEEYEHCDLNKAIEYATTASENGHEFAGLLLAKIYSDKENDCYNIQTAISYLEKYPDNDFALYKLGKIFLENEDIQNDIEKAIHYFEKASKMGNEHAQFALGKIYSDMESPYYNITTAISYLERAAAQNNSFAQYALAKILIEESPYQNIERSIALFKSSAEQGNEFAQFALGKIYSDMESPYYNITTAISYLEKAAAQNNSFAMAKLGSIYLWGSHAPVIKANVELGKSYLKLASENGNPYAEETLKMYENFKNSFVINTSYSLIMKMFSVIAQGNHKRQAHDIEKTFASKVKKQLQAEAKRNKNSSRSIDDD